VTVLAVAWCADQPWRVGEVAILQEDRQPRVLGRGGDVGGSQDRVHFCRQRPGRLVPSSPLTAPGISRRQLVLRTSPGGRLDVESVGQCLLFVNGERRERADVADGDVIYLRRQIVLLCLRRPSLISASRHFPRTALGEFGEPDAHGIVGESPAMWKLREALGFMAQSNVHGLLVGGSGSGKELAARAVHALSERASHPFVARNAVTLPPGLIDAELFGNMRNYPNPGMPERTGLIAEADGGTLFLDEIGELPLELQSHLLRVVDSDGEYQRLGEARSRRSNFRLIGATNRDPAVLKHDLLARLTARITLPSLAERREDIPLLLRNLLLRAAKRNPRVAGQFVSRDSEGRVVVRVEPSFIEYVLRHDWPTNTRGLDGLLWQSLSESEGEALELPRALRPKPRMDSGPPVSIRRDPRDPIVEPTKEEIAAQLALAGGNVSQAARALGLSTRFALYRLMKKHALERGTSS
jgi:DNA-binding NtrC family response regulator